MQRPTPPLRRAHVYLLLLLALALTPVLEAHADIYKYLTKEGEVIITTQPRRGLKLIDVIRSGKRKARPKPAATPRRATSARSPSAPSSAAKVSAGPRSQRYDAIISEAAQAYGLPFAFIKAVIRIESNFNPKAVSRVGAMGLMQLMPGTAEDMGVSDPFDPRQNIFGGTKYLRLMTNRYNGDINLVLSAYHAGPGNVDKVSGVPFDATQDYVRNVYGWYQRYGQQEAMAAK